MRRVIVLLTTALALAAMAPAAFADNQPGQGERSTDRNPAGFGGGPHCHVLTVDSAQEQFVIRVFPSHTGHDNSRSGVMAADPNCDGTAG